MKEKISKNGSVKETVSYNSRLNGIALNGFGERDMNIFFTLLGQAKDEGTKKLKFKIADIRRAAGVTTHKLSNKDFMELVEKSARTKWFLFQCTIDDEEKRKQSIPIFEDITWDDREMTFRIAEDATGLINDLENYTTFSLKRFVAIDGRYAKTLFRNLSQFNSGNGRHQYSISIADFRQIYCVPKTYDSDAIMRQIIKPSMKELEEDFHDLKCVPQYGKTKGNPVTGYTFRWTGISKNIQEEEIDCWAKLPTSGQDEEIEDIRRKIKWEEDLLSDLLFCLPDIVAKAVSEAIKVMSGEILSEAAKAAAKTVSGEIKCLLKRRHWEEGLISSLPDKPDNDEIPFCCVPDNSEDYDDELPF